MSEENPKALRAQIVSTAASTITLRVLDGELSAGDDIVVVRSGQVANLTSLRVVNELIEANLNIAVVAAAGEIVAAAAARAEISDQFQAQILWLSEQDMVPGRSYTLVCAGQTVSATITRLKYKVEQASGKHIAASTIAKDETFIANLSLSSPIVLDPVSTQLKTSLFELTSGDTHILAQGEIQHSLRRASNIHWQALEVDKAVRSALKHQTPKIVWLTGLSASGKSTIANLVEKKLLAKGMHTYLLDGDNVRQGINKDLGFTEVDRVENIRRIGEISKLMLDAGLIVIASFISPFRAERRMVRALFDHAEFIEVHVDASLAICEAREPKGLYKKARQGGIQNFTGLDSPYEVPEKPELKIETETESAEEAATKIVEYLSKQR
jgi:bifunctional enzyme CysN/CysC